MAIQYNQAKLWAKKNQEVGSKLQTTEKLHDCFLETLDLVYAAEQQVLAFQKCVSHKPYQESAAYLRYQYLKKKLALAQGIWQEHLALLRKG